VLSGDDQWYCRNCKVHRNINKKLELYKVPKILILQLRRFTSRKTGSSGFFNLAYA
jgi:ubiquitin carboxyl-terminal hydrolase 4/11